MTCPFCGQESNDVEIRHRNTSYQEEPLNYRDSCLRCWEADYSYYQDLWDEYYKSR